MYEVIEKLLAISFSCLILSNCLLLRWLVRAPMLFPANIMSIFWFFMTFLPLTLLFSVPIEPLSILFIYGCTLAFSLSALCFKWKSSFARNRSKNPVYFEAPFLWKCFWFSQVISVFLVCYTLLQQSLDLDQFVEDFYSAAGAYTELRYAEELNQDLGTRLALPLTYAGAAIGGLIIAAQRTKFRQRMLLIGVFLPSLLVMLTQSSKGAFFLCGALFFGGVMINRLYQQKSDLIDSGVVKGALVAGTVALPLVLISFVSRGMSDSGIDYITWKLQSYLLSYAFAHIYAFSDWFNWYLDKGITGISFQKIDMSFGYFSFMAVFELFGAERVVEKGIFTEYFRYGEYLKTNIFTSFRGLTIDFGVPGALIFFFFFGLLIHFCFMLLLRQRFSPLMIVIFIGFIGYVYQSYIISFLNYRSTYLSMFILWFCLWFSSKRLVVKWSGTNS
jgi:oligosaccharide repeat unit polymerase